MASPSSRSGLLRMGAVVVALLAVIGLALLATGGGSGSDGDRGELSRDVLLTVVEPDRLVLQTTAP